jgi:ssDNA-binding Zn-finger/Zn-ribbon topoisomerase 1
MRCNCKKCHYVWDQLGFNDENGIPVESSYHCPKCGTENGISQKDSIRKMYKKMGLDEPKFYD